MIFRIMTALVDKLAWDGGREVKTIVDPLPSSAPSAGFQQSLDEQTSGCQMKGEVKWL